MALVRDYDQGEIDCNHDFHPVSISITGVVTIQALAGGSDYGERGSVQLVLTEREARNLRVALNDYFSVK